MRLAAVVESYVRFKRALGMRMCSEAAALRKFSRAMGPIDIADVKPKAVRTFILGSGPVTASCKQTWSVLHSFYRYANGRGFANRSPLPTTLPKLPPPGSPYIYSTGELKRLLAGTDSFKTLRAPWRGQAFRTLILLLYGSGLRIGEALSLTLRDVDLTNRLITVRKGKFFKERLVPYGPKLGRELANYARIRRHRQPLPAGDESSFFANTKGTRWDLATTQKFFRKLCIRARVVRDGGPRRQPRLHDLRHTAAQHRIEQWYRQGRDVQRLLPQLSTYLGHRDVSGTQRYLHMTPELLREASQRFEHYAQP